MSTINTGNAYLDSLGGTQPVGATSSSTIDQAGFLKLLTTQLQTQDPTQPMDDNQMVNQMTSFSQLSGITEMNASLKSMAGDISTSRFGNAANLVGRDALVSSKTAAALSNGAYAGEITLPSDAADVTITLTDASGNTVHAADLGAHKSGAVDWSWDGKSSDGKTVAASGTLTMTVTATDASGNAVTPGLSAWTEVQGVQSPASGTTKLTTGLGTFAPTDVIQLS